MELSSSKYRSVIRTCNTVRLGATVALLLAVLPVSCNYAEPETVPSGQENTQALMTFRTDVESMPGSKAVLEPGNLDNSGSRIVVYDRLAIDGNPDYDVYIDGQTAGYLPSVDQDGNVTAWNFLTVDSQIKKYYWTKSGRHSFTAFTSQYSFAANGETVHAPIEKRGLTLNGIVESDEDNPNAGKYENGLNYNPRHEYLVIKNWTIDMTNQFDFMYAHHTRDLDDPDDLNPYREVPLQMKHLLCAVKFNITNLVPYEETSSQRGPEKILRKFSLPDGVRSTASALITSAGADIILDDDSRSAYSKDFGTAGLVLEYGEAKTENIFSDEGNIGTDGFILLWPQSLSGLSAVLEYTDRTEKREWSLFGGFEWVTSDNDLTSDIPLATNSFTSWQPGRKYIYNIYIQDNRISFTVQVVDWIYDDVAIEG